MASKNSQPQSIEHRTDFLSAAAVVVFLIIFFTITYVFLTDIEIFPPQKESQPAVVETPTPTAVKDIQQIMEIPFNYVVTDLFERFATLEGDMGPMELTMNPDSVTLYQGLPPNATEVPIDRLQIDDQVHLKIVPGEKAWVYIVP